MGTKNLRWPPIQRRRFPENKMQKTCLWHSRILHVHFYQMLFAKKPHGMLEYASFIQNVSDITKENRAAGETTAKISNR